MRVTRSAFVPAVGGLLLALVACSAPPRRSDRTMDDALSSYAYRTAPPDDGDPLAAAFARPPLREVDARIATWASEVAPPRETRSTGKPWAGRLDEAAELPEQGPGYTTFKPHRFGTWQVIHTLTAGIAEVLLRYPDSAPVVVGDLSAATGGHLSPHRSHQNGLDIDIGYFHDGNRSVTRFQDATDGTLDAPKTLTLLEGLLRTGWVDLIFVDRKVQRPLIDEAKTRGWSDDLVQRIFGEACDGGCRNAVVRHSKGHHNHLHLRVKCDPAGDECKADRDTGEERRALRVRM